MNNWTTIYVARHAESRLNKKLNEDGVFDSEDALYSPLTKLGEEQARALSEKLKNIKFDKFYSSELTRANDTAKAVAGPHGLEVEKSPELKERSLYEFADKNKIDYVKAREEVKNQLMSLGTDEEKMNYKYMDKLESPRDGAERLKKFLQYVAKSHPGKTIFVGCHGNIMRSFLTLIGWAKFDELPSTACKPTGYFVLETDGREFKIIETSSLEKMHDTRRIF